MIAPSESQAKVCAWCGLLLPITAYTLRAPGKPRRECKSCKAAAMKRYRADNLDHHLSVQRAWRARPENKQRIKGYRDRERDRGSAKRWRHANAETQGPKAVERARQWRLKHPDRYNSASREVLKRGRNDLSERYVLDLLTKRSPLTFSDIPRSLVEAKRINLQIQRLLRKEKP